MISLTGFTIVRIAEVSLKKGMEVSLLALPIAITKEAPAVMCIGKNLLWKRLFLRLSNDKLR